MVAEQTEDDTGAPYFGNPLIAKMLKPPAYRKRRWHIEIDNLPAAMRNALDTDGEYTVRNVSRFNAVRGAMKRIRDGAQHTGLD